MANESQLLRFTSELFNQSGSELVCAVRHRLPEVVVEIADSPLSKTRILLDGGLHSLKSVMTGEDSMDQDNGLSRLAANRPHCCQERPHNFVRHLFGPLALGFVGPAENKNAQRNHWAPAPPGEEF